jgi:hypothetical protein
MKSLIFSLLVILTVIPAGQAVAGLKDGDYGAGCFTTSANSCSVAIRGARANWVSCESVIDGGRNAPYRCDREWGIYEDRRAECAEYSYCPWY